MPCFTVWSAPISPAATAPDVISILQVPGAAAALAIAAGVAVATLLPPDQVIQEIMAKPPELPAVLRERGYRVRQTSQERRLSRRMRDGFIVGIGESGRLLVESLEAQQQITEAEREYDLRLRAAEGKRAAFARRIPWAPQFIVYAQSILEEVKTVVPDARLTTPLFEGESGTSRIKSESLGDTAIVITADLSSINLEVRGSVPEDIDVAMTQALARGFARLKVEPGMVEISPRPSAPVPAEIAEEVSGLQVIVNQVLERVQIPYVD